jgi:NitT/TauT family transport system permease protein
MNRDRALVHLVRLGVVVAFLGAWEWAAREQISFSFPSPAATLTALITDVASGELPAATGRSVYALGVGLALAVAVGVPFGLLMGMAPGVGRVASVYLDVLIALPMAALIPLVILTFGIGTASAAAVVFIFSAPFVIMNAYGGVRDVPARLAEMARSFDASRLALFRLIVVPAAAPMIFTGLRYGLSRAFVGLIVVELLLSPSGLGKIIVTRRSVFEYDHMFATIVWTIALAVTTLVIVQRIEARVLKWQRGA